MAQEKIYVKGFRTFAKSDKAPDFVLGSLVITPREFVDWIKENKELLTDYKGAKQLKVQILQGKESINFVVDTYKPTPNTGEKDFEPKKEEIDDLPF